MSKQKEFVVKVPKQGTRYVAINSMEDSTVIAHGTSPDIVAKKAAKIKKNSDSKPVILYVPNPDEKYIY